MAWHGLAAPAGASDPFAASVPADAYLLKGPGSLIWQRNPNQALAPASLTKLMTLVLAVRHCRIEDVVTVSAGAGAETGTRLGLKAGEKIHAGSLIAAALLASANDACRALADHIAGSHERFVAVMNATARAMGLKATGFANACGHDARGHVSSAVDLAALAEAALQHRLIADLAAQVHLDIRTIDTGRFFHLTNTNELVGRYPGAVGLKTGFTPAAGKCLIAAVNRQGQQVMLVLLNAPQRWWSATAMLDAALSARVGQP